MFVKEQTFDGRREVARQNDETHVTGASANGRCRGDEKGSTRRRRQRKFGEE